MGCGTVLITTFSAPVWSTTKPILGGSLSFDEGIENDATKELRAAGSSGVGVTSGRLSPSMEPAKVPPRMTRLEASIASDRSPLVKYVGTCLAQFMSPPDEYEPT